MNKQVLRILEITTGMETWDSTDTLLAESSAIGGRFGLSLLFRNTFLLKRVLVFHVNFAKVGRPRTTFIAKRRITTYLIATFLAKSVFIKAKI